MLFPDRLHAMLQDAEGNGGFADIVSWVGDFHFRVHHRERFERSILPMYFESTKFKSFRRQLNLYRFECIQDNRHGKKGCYTNPYFSRHSIDMDAILFHRRIAIKESASSLTKSPRRRIVSPSSSSAAAASGSLSTEFEKSVPDSKDQDSKTILEPVLWPLDLNDDNDTNFWLPPRVDLSHQESSCAASILPANHNNNWWDHVPQDIQDEIVATFSACRQQP